MTAWWRRENRNEAEGQRRFAVLVHARDLLVRSDDGSYLPGGVFTWRCITAENADVAAQLAIEAVVNNAAYAEEVDPASIASFAVDEIVELQPNDEREGSGFVFYLQTDDDDGNKNKPGFGHVKE